jgi:hypothetical protein
MSFQMIAFPAGSRQRLSPDPFIAEPKPIRFPRISGGCDVR